MQKTASLRKRRNDDSYLSLIHRFPLRPIRNDDELDRAIDVIDSLLDQKRLDAGQRDYLDVLSDLVEHYEEEHHPIPAPSDAQMLAYLLELRDAKQAEVAGKTGIATSTISEILAGKRQLTRGHIEKLAAYFHVEPGVFLASR